MNLHQVLRCAQSACPLCKSHWHSNAGGCNWVRSLKLLNSWSSYHFSSYDCYFLSIWSILDLTQILAFMYNWPMQLFYVSEPLVPLPTLFSEETKFLIFFYTNHLTLSKFLLFKPTMAPYSLQYMRINN